MVPLSYKDFTTVEHLFLALMLESSNQNTSPYLLAPYFKLIISYHRHFRKSTTSTSGMSNIMTNFINELEAYYLQSRVEELPLPTVNLLASKLKISPNYLSQTLRRQTGRSAMDHIHQFIIQKAQEMLSGSDAPINQIAYQLGFEYPNYFARLFRKVSGMSPTEYRSSMDELGRSDQENLK